MFPTNIRLQKQLEFDPRSSKTASHLCFAVSSLSPSTPQIPVSDQHPKDGRRSANYQPTIWSYDFLQSLKNEHNDTIYRDRAAKLEQELRFALADEDAESVNLLELIDDIQRLGLAHRFEMDISRALEKIASGVAAAENSLHATALRFRLLRQHGYDVSQGILSTIYWAKDKDLSEQVSHALELPLHRRALRMEARWYIEAYSKKTSANLQLLELAKLDFNMVQSKLQEDLQDMSRWDVRAVKNLPDYMKLCYLALYNSVNEMAYDSLRDDGENILPYLSKASPHINDKALESLENYHDLLRWPSLIFRLCNDLGTSKDELETGESANSITCYMKEIGCSEAMARQHINGLIDESWKRLSKCQIDGSPFGKHLVETAINLARISHCTYQHGDAHGRPDSKSNNRVISLIIEPFSIME
ncbi:hypothetical protein COLO4_13037 [Corchorus olitorius]|uniref:Uncharacterized protein n=1 Tax=Corchorus olitorius TaxID=93759 RepID=A0A1R3JYN8_9ROSI|nr:hypothetical protein COLO4_13037 [Corchorus olitorius]